MKIRVYYTLDGQTTKTEVIEVPDNADLGAAAIAHARSKGSRHFPHYAPYDESEQMKVATCDVKGGRVRQGTYHADP